MTIMFKITSTIFLFAILYSSGQTSTILEKISNSNMISQTVTVKNLEQQISISFIARCHRSFIVNLANVVKVKGNARGYKLQLKNYPELIPVSKDSHKEVFKKIESLNPVAS